MLFWVSCILLGRTVYESFIASACWQGCNEPELNKSNGSNQSQPYAIQGMSMQPGKNVATVPFPPFLFGKDLLNFMPPKIKTSGGILHFSHPCYTTASGVNHKVCNIKAGSDGQSSFFSSFIHKIGYGDWRWR